MAERPAQEGEARTCRVCKGSGYVRIGQVDQHRCPDCGGTGWSRPHPAPAAHPAIARKRLPIHPKPTRGDLNPPVIGHVELEVSDAELFDIALTPVIYAGGDKPPRLGSWQVHARTDTDIRPREPEPPYRHIGPRGYPPPVDDDDHREHHRRDDDLVPYGERILDSLHALHSQFNDRWRELMADLTALQAAVDSLVTAEGSAAAEMQALVAEIATLQAGSVTQEQIDAVTQKATDAVNALNAATTSAQEAEQPPAPAPEPEPAPAPEPTPEPAPAPEPSPEPGPTPEPTPEPSPEPTPSPEPAPAPVPGVEPTPEPTPSPEPTPPGPTPEEAVVPPAPAEAGTPSNPTPPEEVGP